MNAYGIVRQVLIEEMNVDEDRISPQSSLAELEMDSLEFVFLVTALEGAFETEVLEDDFEKLRTVQDVADYAERQAQRVFPPVPQYVP